MPAVQLQTHHCPVSPKPANTAAGRLTPVLSQLKAVSVLQAPQSPLAAPLPQSGLVRGGRAAVPGDLDLKNSCWAPSGS